MATSLANASAALARIHRLDPERECVLFLPTARDATSAWVAAYERPCVPTRLLRVDHNVAPKPVYALRVAWGAAVPLFEGDDQDATPQGVWARARGALKTAANVQRELRRETTPWSVAVNETTLESRAGIACGTKGVVPTLLGAALTLSDGVWNGSGSAVSIDGWKPILATPWHIRLAGAGTLLVDEQTRRVSAMDAVHLEAGPTVALAVVD